MAVYSSASIDLSLQLHKLRGKLSRVCAVALVCVGAATAMGRGAGRSVASAQQVRTLLLRSLGQLDQQQPYPENVLRQAVGIVQARLDEAGSQARVTQYS